MKTSYPGNIIQTVHQSTRPKIAAFGEWNTTNLGDRAIFESVIAFFEELGWAVEGYGLGTLTHVTNSAKPVSDFPEALDTFTDSETTLVRVQRSHRQTALASSLKRPLRGIRQQVRIRQLLPQLRQAQAIMVGGGALLSDWNLHFPQSLAALTWAAKQLNIPMICLGCSAEGSWSMRGEKIIQDFALSCRYIATRDQTTADRIAKLIAKPIDVFGDFALRETNCFDNAGSDGAIAINVMELPELFAEHQKAYEDALVEIIHTLTLHKVGISNNSVSSVKLFTTGTPEDTAPAKRVLARLGREDAKLFVPQDLNSLRSTLSTSQLVVAARLHAAILALSEGVPVIGFSVGPKIERFLRALDIEQFSVEATEPLAAETFLKILDNADLRRQFTMMNWLNIRNVRAKATTLFNKIQDESSLRNF